MYIVHIFVYVIILYVLTIFNTYKIITYTNMCTIYMYKYDISCIHDREQVHYK